MLYNIRKTQFQIFTNLIYENCWYKENFYYYFNNGLVMKHEFKTLIVNT